MRRGEGCRWGGGGHEGREESNGCSAGKEWGEGAAGGLGAHHTRVCVLTLDPKPQRSQCIHGV